MRRFHPETALLLFGAVLVGFLLFARLGHPLLWQDEGETAMFAERVLEFGYPVVHGPRNVLYEFGSNVAVGIDERTDAYIGTTWGHFYYAVPGALAARHTADPYAKTLCLRLPFALAGAAGIALWLVALTPAFRDEPRRRRLFAALYLLLIAGSTSLLLHLREARYHGPLLLLFAGVATIQLRRRIAGGCRGGAYTALQSLLLLLVFHTFFAAWFFLAALLGLDGLVAAASARPPERLRRALHELAPVLLSALFVAPGLVFFETLANAARFGADVGASPGGYVANLAFFLRHFATYELLVAALLARLAALALRALAARRGVPLADPGRQRTATRLAWFVAGYAALSCLNPLVYERYFVPLVPALTGLFLLDAFDVVLVARALAGPGRRRRAGALAAAALVLAVVVTGAPRAEALRGRLQEIAVPVRGPVDFIVEYVRASVPHPESLVIATNYENHPLMYYLGSHVIVGTNLNNIVRERSLEPDLVIPRRRWPRGQDELRAFLRRGGYARHELPVRDLHFNAIAALSRSRWQPDTHHFETVAPGREGGLVVFDRREPAP